MYNSQLIPVIALAITISILLFSYFYSYIFCSRAFSDTQSKAKVKRLSVFTFVVLIVSFIYITMFLFVCGTSCLNPELPILAVASGSPAQVAGIKECDTILKIDGVSLADIHDLNKLIISKRGSEIALLVEKAGGGEH